MTAFKGTFPTVTFTELTDKNAVLTKQYGIFMGCFKKIYPGIMSDGSSKQMTMQLDQLIPYFASLNEHQAICHGLTENPLATITVKSRESKDSIARTKENYSHTTIFYEVPLSFLNISTIVCFHPDDFSIRNPFVFYLK